MLCFDNGGVHNLVVGSEPTHCNGYLYVYIYRFKLYYPTLGGVKLYGLCLNYCYLLLYDLPGDVPVLSIVWVWHPRDCVREAYKRIGHAEIFNF